MTAGLDGRSPVVRRDGEGISRLWGQGSVVTTKLSAAETGGALGVTHFSAVRGERAPRHTHTLEDEIFIIEGGEVRLTVADRTEIVNGAGVLFLPRGIPHSYLVESETARFYVVTTPGGFERFFSEAGHAVRPDNSAPVGRPHHGIRGEPPARHHLGQLSPPKACTDRDRYRKRTRVP